jgi:hypothetical protein
VLRRLLEFILARKKTQTIDLKKQTKEVSHVANSEHKEEVGESGKKLLH